MFLRDAAPVNVVVPLTVKLFFRDVAPSTVKSFFRDVAPVNVEAPATLRAPLTVVAPLSVVAPSTIKLSFRYATPLTVVAPLSIVVPSTVKLSFKDAEPVNVVAPVTFNALRVDVPVTIKLLLIVVAPVVSSVSNWPFHLVKPDVLSGLLILSYTDCAIITAWSSLHGLYNILTFDFAKLTFWLIKLAYPFLPFDRIFSILLLYSLTLSSPGWKILLETSAKLNIYIII